MNEYDNLLTGHALTAEQLFLDGCNCSQAVFAAFCDVTGIDKEFALRMSSPFGGGMGRLREVCGAFSAIVMVLGITDGIADCNVPGAKAELYKKVQALANEFKRSNGSLICRELLGLPEGSDSPVPTPRTDEFYKTRPCAGIIASAASILDDYLLQNKNRH